MLNKKIEEKLTKMKETEIIKYIEYLENDLSNERAIKNELIDERRKITEDLKEKVEIQTTIIKLNTDDEKNKRKVNT